MKDGLKVAVQVARKIGMVPTWPNLQTIRLAIETEAELCGVSVGDVANMLVRAAGEYTRTGSQYRPAADWEYAVNFRLNVVDRFWFEDARWRAKLAYGEFRSQLLEAR